MPRKFAVPKFQYVTGNPDNAAPYPDLTPWEDTIVYDSSGKIASPSALSWQCEVIRGIEKNLTTLTYVKRHIRNFAFGIGLIKNAYPILKGMHQFSHELVHILLGQYGRVLDRNPSMFAPFYDANMQAEALVLLL